jgi:hypothetical protein
VKGQSLLKLEEAREISLSLSQAFQPFQNNSRLYNSFTLSFPKLPNLPKKLIAFLGLLERAFRIALWFMGTLDAPEAMVSMSSSIGFFFLQFH